MAKKWDEKLADVSVRLEELSKKAADASEDAKAARELRDEAIQEKISDVKGDVVALQENMRIDAEENKSKLRTALLKAQMTIRAKIEDHREEKDKKLFEAYLDNQVDYIYDCFDMAAYLIANAELAILETLDAVDEYDKKYGSEDAQ